MPDKMRVGIGYDVHRLAEGRPLVLGGVVVPFERGLLGWSDADVLVHAIIDALLGAAALGDIGTYFPPGDRKYEGISSIVLLQRVREIIDEAGWQIENIDATVIAQEPRLLPYIDEMRRNIGEALGISREQIGLKASTSDGLGFVGRGEGIAAQVVALMERL